MGLIFYFWSFILVLSISLTGLAIRSLALSGIPLSESLVVRGFVCAMMVFIWAGIQGMPLIPKSIKTQTVRAFIAGLALTFFSLSYNWLSASTIAVISNVDVPLLVILGGWVGQSSAQRTKLLAGVSIVLLVIYSLKLNAEPNWVLGLSTLLTGLFLLCFGYAFIKKSMSEENRAITILTPAIAIILYGIIQKATDGPQSIAWDFNSLCTVVVSGAGMFGAYYSTMKLYELTDIAKAEFPTLIASIVIQPLEMILFKEPLRLSHFALSIAFVVCTYFILNSEREMDHAE